MNKLILGIDPCCTGAIAKLDDEFNYIDHLLMPTIKTGKSNRVNGAAIVAFLGKYELEHAFLEQVHSMPGQRVASTFNFAHAAGVIEGVIQGMFIPYTLVLPNRWKQKANLIGKDEDASRSLAVRLYPEVRELDKKIKGQALSDALLIARFSY